jgi:cell division transport system permease protein
MMALSVATISVSLIVFGIFLILSVNINHLANFMTSKLEIRIYLKEAVTKPERLDFQEKLRKLHHVKKVLFVDKDDAWVQFKESFPNLELDNRLKTNPLPDALKILFEKDIDFYQVSTYLKRFDHLVEEVSYGEVIAERIKLFSKFAKLGGIILVALLTVATLLIVTNTIRLTVIARQIEIEIMQLVGATNQFIRWPFIIEGILIGIMGAVIAVAFLKPFYAYVGNQFQEKMTFFPLVFEGDILGLIYISIAALGIFLGVLGAFISVSRSLKTTF